MIDHYRVLNVGAEASLDAIHRAYRMLARAHHPDRNPGPERAAQMARINEAYACLSDPARRRAYDRSLRVIEPVEFQRIVLAAADEVLARGAWGRTELGPMDRLFEKDRLKLAVRLEPVLGADELDAWRRRLGVQLRRERVTCGVVIAFRVLDPENAAWAAASLRNGAALDLIEARLIGPPLPPPCTELLDPLVLS